MASTIYSYNLTGGKVFPVAFEYLARRFVKITLIGATRQELQLNVDYRFISKTEIETTIVWAPGEFQTIEVRRVTSATDRLVNFTDGSILRSQDLNISQIQAIHIAEEGRDISNSAMIPNGIRWDALGFPMGNLGDPVDPQDAVTKSYADGLSIADRAYTDQSIGGTVRSPFGESLLALPPFNLRAGKLLTFDQAGNPQVVSPVSGSATDLAIQLADGNQGTGMVFHKPNLPGAVSRSARDVISEMYVSICSFGATVIDNDNSPAIRRAWMGAPDGSTILIPSGRFRLGTALRLPTRNLNIRCDGVLVVGAGTWDGVTFEGAPDVTLPGTALSGVTKGGMKLNFVGTPPVSDPHNYFFDIETSEVYTNRVTQADYTPYTKSEPHAVMSYDWRISDPFLHTHDSLNLAVLHLTKKNSATVIDGLHLETEGDADITYRNLLRIRSQSNIEFNDLELDSTASNRFGVGLGTSKCYNIRFNRPKVNGYNISGIQGDISYPSASHLSSFIHFNGYVLEQSVEDTGRPGNPKRSRGSIDHYCNHIYFDGCLLAGGTDAHIGSNYFITDCTLLQNGFSFVGTNATMTRVRGVDGGMGHRSLFSVRGDAPYCHGKLTIKDCEIPSEWLAVYLTTGIANDPLGRTAKYKMFDEIEIDGINIVGEGTQSFNTVFNFGGVRNFTVFPTIERTNRISIRNVKSNGKMLNNTHSFMRVGDADVAVESPPCIVVSEFIIEGLRLPRTGRFNGAAYSGDIVFGPCDINVFTVKDSTGISMHRIRGMKELELSHVKTGTKGEMYFDKFTNISALIESCEINVPLNAAAAGPIGTNTLSLVDNVFNAMGGLQNTKIVRGNGNVVAASVTIPPMFVGKLNGYTDIATYRTSTADIILGTSVPARAPTKIGQEYMDTVAKKSYKAFGTSSPADWVVLN